ncbi:hypothetical protein [Herbaspirillum autotrophicum]|uniref:hypothetical protein n=1 Tax=Herbaspirillum autotrophicum TaxID=180195 RepID=UPI000B0F5A32|nr:hypothetical protein [Herbaspirillum autotrophicum]
MMIRSCKTGSWLWPGVMLCWLLLAGAAVEAVEVTINAEFKMPPGGAERRFIVAGKATGLCADAPSLCNVRESSVLLPQLRAALYPPRGQKQIWYPPPVRARSIRPREGPSAQLQFPGAKKVMVTHTTSGASYPVTFAPRLLNGRLHGIFGQTFSGYLKHQDSCWILHGTLCKRYAMNGSEIEAADVFSLVYQIHTPDPQRMLAGEYTARIEYTTGPGKELDFGRHFKFNDNKIVVNLVLKVVTDIAVDAKFSRVVLSPAGGWDRWKIENSASVPGLRYDMPFYLTSSAPFRVYIEGADDFCHGRCVLRNEKALATVVMDIAMTLPFVTKADGSEVRNMPVTILPLRPGARPPETLQPRHYLYRQRSFLHLRVTPDRVEQMLRFRGGLYHSQFNIIFDADL